MRHGDFHSASSKEYQVPICCGILDTKSELEPEESVRKIRETNKNALRRCREAKKKQVQDKKLELELLSKRNNMLHQTLLHKEEEVSKLTLYRKEKGAMLLA